MGGFKQEMAADQATLLESKEVLLRTDIDRHQGLDG